MILRLADTLILTYLYAIWRVYVSRSAWGLAELHKYITSLDIKKTTNE